MRVLLTGRVLQRGDTLNVQAELIDAAANSQVWGQKYSRTLSDICAVEEQIAREIADTLRVKLNRADKTRLAHRATQDGEAYQLYLRGRYLWNRRTRDALGRAIVYLQQAIDRDPAYALAYAGLADCYGVLGTFTFAAPGETFPRAKAAARRAIEIDENLAEAHVTLAMVEMFFDGNRETAEREFRRALALNANYAVAHQWYGMHRCFVADFEHGLAELDYARQLEPLSPMINVQLGVGLCLARRSDEAAHILRNTLAFEPAFWPAHLFLAMVSMQQHDQTHAIAEAELATELSERHPIAVSALGYVLGRTGAVPRAAQLLAELSARAQTEYIDPYHFALVHLALGDETLALQRLQEAVAGQSPYALWRVVDPRLDPLRANVSFTALLPDPFGSDAVTPVPTEKLMTQNIRTDDGVTIEYNIYGSGPLTSLFLHGWGNAADSWDDLITTRLNLAGLRCVAASYRGHGGSDEARSGYTHDRFARDMFNVADAAGADAFVMIGFSMAAKFGRYMAYLHPQRVFGQVLIAPPGPEKLAVPREAFMPWLEAAPTRSAFARSCLTFTRQPIRQDLLDIVLSQCGEGLARRARGDHRHVL